MTLAAELRGDPTPHRGIRLSPSQHRVVRLAGEGLTNQQIGGVLGVTEQTVKFHMSGAMARLGANDRAHAAMLLARRESAPALVAECVELLDTVEGMVADLAERARALAADVEDAR